MVGQAIQRIDSGRSSTVEEVLAKVSGYHIEEFIHSVLVYDIKEHNHIYIPMEYLRVGMVNYPNNCRSLDLSEVSELNVRRCNQLMVIFVSWEIIQSVCTLKESLSTLTGTLGNTTCIQLETTSLQKKKMCQGGILSKSLKDDSLKKIHSMNVETTPIQNMPAMMNVTTSL